MAELKKFEIPSLDGMRALAAGLVFVAHAGLGDFVPGGLGVTVFFFLSGYLITTLLRQEYIGKGRIDFGKFYLRRALRLFPPLYIVLLIVIVITSFGLFSQRMRLDAIVSQIFYWSNYYYIIVGTGYFPPGTAVTWSLAVEEHFYFAFPILYVCLVKRFTGIGIARVLGLLCLLALGWRIIGTIFFDMTVLYTYHATDTRFDSILFGSIMGVWRNPMLDKREDVGVNLRRILIISALIVLVFTLAYRSEFFRGTFRYSLQGVALFVIFWLAIRYPSWWPFRWLNWRPIRFLGLISYTFYLSHLIIIFLVNSYISSNIIVRGALAFILAFGFSSLMYYSVERPIAKWRSRFRVI